MTAGYFIIMIEGPYFKKYPNTNIFLFSETTLKVYFFKYVIYPFIVVCCTIKYCLYSVPVKFEIKHICHVTEKKYLKLVH
jgi:hypothetical protein